MSGHKPSSLVELRLTSRGAVQIATVTLSQQEFSQACGSVLVSAGKIIRKAVVITELDFVIYERIRGNHKIQVVDQH
jgi:hypothetical protein